MTQDISDEAVERFSASASYTGIMKPSRDGLWVQYHDYAAIVARLKEVEAERDRQYDHNVERIAKQEAAETKLAIAKAALQSIVGGEVYLGIDHFSQPHEPEQSRTARQALTLIYQPTDII